MSKTAEEYSKEFDAMYGDHTPDLPTSKAEQAALEAYPVNMTPLNYQDLIEQFGGKTEIDVNTYPRCLFQVGYEQAEKDLGWHSPIEHPPVDEEVIVLLGNYDDLYEIAVGHIVNKDIAIDYNGWNIPGVRYWMPMPEIPKEEKK